MIPRIARGRLGRVVWKTTLGFPITLSQQSRDKFTVSYGAEVTSGLTYSEAAERLGHVIFHGLTCEGKIRS